MITAIEAWELANSDKQTVIIDIRTTEEWKETGIPKLENKVFTITSHFKPNMNLNHDFLLELGKVVHDKDTKVIFICKTNGRSNIAANLALQHGYKNSIVVIDGFEGNSVGLGWKASGLPYKVM